MNNEDTWVFQMFDQARQIESTARQLAQLADAFDRIGNELVAGELFEAAQVLRANGNAIRDLTGERTQAGLREAQAMTGLILKAFIEPRSANSNHSKSS